MYASEVFETEKGSESPAKKRRVSSDKAVIAEGKAFFAEVLNVVAEGDDEEEPPAPVEETPETPDSDKELVPESQDIGEELGEVLSANLLSLPVGHVEDTLGDAPTGGGADEDSVEVSPEKVAPPPPPPPPKPPAKRQSWDGVDTVMLPPPSPQKQKGAGDGDEAQGGEDVFELQPEGDDLFRDMFGGGSEVDDVRKLLWEEDEPAPKKPPAKVESKKKAQGGNPTMLQVEDALRWCVTHGRPHRGLLKTIQSDLVNEVAAAADASRVFRIALIAFFVTDRCDLPGPLGPLPSWQVTAIENNAPKHLITAFNSLTSTCLRCRLQWAKSLLKSVNATLAHLPANSPFLPPPFTLRSDFAKLHALHSVECTMYKRRNRDTL